MRNSILILFFLFLYTSGYSQSGNELSDGYTVFKYPNGTISSEGFIKNGKPDGFWKSYYVSGVKKSEGKRTNFLLDSIWVFFDQEGDTLEKINYLFGKKNGYYYKYKKDPFSGLYIWSVELYAGDKKEGTGYIYYPDGKIKQSISYNGGKKEGLSKEYDDDGLIISLLEYSNDFLVNRERINRVDNNGLKQGSWKDFYINGNIKTEKTFVDDQLNGYYKEYDQKGNLILTMLYDKGSVVESNVKDDPEIEVVNKYNSDGKLIYSGPYRSKIPVGIHREYSVDGKITNSFIYNDVGVVLSEGIVDESGKKTGKWKDFYPDHKLLDEGQYTDNRKTGLWKFYNEAGKIEQTGYFNSDRSDGLWQWYYEDGSLLREEEYFQGNRDGSFTEYSKTGEIIVSGTYSDGEKNGEWMTNSGDNKEEGSYIYGLKEGLWKSYYPGDKLRFKGNFVQDNPQGRQVWYWENGNIKEEQYYDMGIREKLWKKYSEEGVVYLTILYKNDIEISINGVKVKLPESDVTLIK